MLNPDTITEHIALLAQHRRTLAVLLAQQAQLGAALAPPEVITGIGEARANIARVKAILRASGVAVENHPDVTEA